MTKCTSCGRNTRSENNENSPINGDKYCAECSDIQGNLLPFSEVLENFANYFMNTLGYDIAVSRNAAMEILKRQPAWEPMFKKEEKMRTKKRMFAIVAGALALILAVTGVIYGFYRYFGTPKDLFADYQPEILDISNGNTTFNELKTDNKIRIRFVLEDKNLVFFANWNGTNWQDYMYDLEKNKGYRLPSKDFECAFVNGQDYVWESRLDNGDHQKIKVLRTMTINDIVAGNDSLEDKKTSEKPNDNTQKIMLCTRDESTNWIKAGNYIFWCEYTTRLNGVDIFGANLATGKEIPICTQPGNQSNITASGNKIFWSDYRNLDSDGFDVYCFDLKSKKEKRIEIQNQSEKIFAWKIVGDNLIYSGKDATGLYVLNLKTGKTNMVTEKKLSGNEVSTKWDYNTQFFTDKSVLPTLLTSIPDSNGDFYIVWEEATGIKYNNKDFESALVTFKKMSQITGPATYIKINTSKDNSQRVESVTDSGITWTEFTSNSKNSDRDGLTLVVDRYKGYGEFFRFFDNEVLNYYDFEMNENRMLEENYREKGIEKNSFQTKDYIVWVPMDVRDGEEINLRYMKIR